MSIRTSNMQKNNTFTLMTLSMSAQDCSQPFGNGGSFSSDFGPFQGLKMGVLADCLGKTSIFKITMTDDVTLWSKLESICVVDFIRPNSIS